MTSASTRPMRSAACASRRPAPPLPAGGIRAHGLGRAAGADLSAGPADQDRSSDGLVSDAQMETVIYAGEAHASILPGSWMLGEAPHQVVLVDGRRSGRGAVPPGLLPRRRHRLRQGPADRRRHRRQHGPGPPRAVWLSKNDALLEDARRDWGAIGGAAVRHHPAVAPGSRPTPSGWIGASSSPPTPPCASRRGAIGPRGSTRSSGGWARTSTG